MDNLLSHQQQVDELKKMQIDFLIAWENTAWGDEIPVYSNLESGLRVYSCTR